MPNLSLSSLLDFAIDAAWQAGKRTLAYYQTAISVDYKADDSPVTIADRQAEELLRRLIQKQFPDHALLGEEFGRVPGHTPYRWILDPIDGTRAFVHGVPFYAVLVGLEIAGQPDLGVAYFPALDEMVWAAKGMGCYWNGRRAHVSSQKQWNRSLVLATDSEAFALNGKAQAYRQIVEMSGEHRTWGDAYGHIMVATGRAEVMLDPAMNSWDCAPLLPILQEAGGTFTDWDGVATIHGDNAISTNGQLYQDVMRVIRAQANEAGH